MNWLKKIRHSAISSRLVDEQIYAQVLKEVERGQRRDGLWAQALAKSQGSSEKAKSLYIEYRAQAIKDEIQIVEDTKTTHETKIAKDTKQPSSKSKVTSNAPQNEEKSTLWIHILVWSIAGIMLLGYIAQ